MLISTSDEVKSAVPSAPVTAYKYPIVDTRKKVEALQQSLQSAEESFEVQCVFRQEVLDELIAKAREGHQKFLSMGGPVKSIESLLKTFEKCLGEGHTLLDASASDGIYQVRLQKPDFLLDEEYKILDDKTKTEYLEQLEKSKIQIVTSILTIKAELKAAEAELGRIQVEISERDARWL